MGIAERKEQGEKVIDAGIEAVEVLRASHFDEETIIEAMTDGLVTDLESGEGVAELFVRALIRLEQDKRDLNQIHDKVTEILAEAKRAGLVID